MQLTGIGLYSFQEASVLTGISVSNLRRWLRGYKSTSGKKTKGVASCNATFDCHYELLVYTAAAE